MINLTLTITAAPELLAAMSGFINSITAAKVVTIPQEPANVTPVYNQSNNGSVNTGNNQGASGPTYPVQAPQQAPVQTPSTQASTVPTSAQSYTMEQLAVAATQLVDAGRRTELLGLLSSFGVQALTALPKEMYGTFATQLRALGAKI